MPEQTENTNLNERNAELSATLKRIDENNAQQAHYAKKQYRMAQISACASVLVLLIVLCVAVVLLPKVVSTFRDLDVIMENIEGITSELAEADVNQLVKDLDTLIVNSEQELGKAMDNFSDIDFDALNSAIKNLNDAVAPLAKLSNLFK